MAEHLKTVLDDYQRAVAALSVAPTPASYVVAALTRDRIACTLRCEPAAIATVENVAKLDEKLREYSAGIPDLGTILERLRRPTDPDWWWCPEPAPETTGQLTIRLGLLAASAIALCLLVEFARRMFTGRPDVVSTVIQGLLATLVGVGSLRLARDVFHGKDDDDESLGLQPATRMRITLVLVAAAILCEVGRPGLARWYDERGMVAAGAQHYSEAVQAYERALQLTPDDGPTHFHLATAAQATLDWTTAEAEYRASLRWGTYMPLAEDRLAHLMLGSKHDYYAALLLTRRGLEAADALGDKMFTSGKDANAIRHSLHAHRAIAFLGSQMNAEAIAEATSAIAIANHASPHCVIAAASEQLKDSKREQAEWNQCIALSGGEEDELEPSWLSHANVRLEALDNGR
jgi:hypothetical protein